MMTRRLLFVPLVLGLMFFAQIVTAQQRDHLGLATLHRQSLGFDLLLPHALGLGHGAREDVHRLPDVAADLVARTVA